MGQELERIGICGGIWIKNLLILLPIQQTVKKTWSGGGDQCENKIYYYFLAVQMVKSSGRGTWWKRDRIKIG